MDAAAPVIMLEVGNYKKNEYPRSITATCTEECMAPGISMYSSSGMAIPNSSWPRLEGANISEEDRT